MTASATDFLTTFTEGFAQLIAGAHVGYAWRDYGSGDPDDAPIFLADVPTGPDRILTLTPTPMAVHPTLNTAAVNLQLRFRAGEDVREVWAMRAATRRVLAGLFPTRLPTGIYISVLTFAYGTPMGIDESRRWMFADNYRTRASETST